MKIEVPLTSEEKLSLKSKFNISIGIVILMFVMFSVLAYFINKQFDQPLIIFSVFFLIILLICFALRVSYLDYSKGTKWQYTGKVTKKTKSVSTSTSGGGTTSGGRSTSSTSSSSSTSYQIEIDEEPVKVDGVYYNTIVIGSEVNIFATIASNIKM